MFNLQTLTRLNWVRQKGNSFIKTKLSRICYIYSKCNKKTKQICAYQKRCCRSGSLMQYLKLPNLSHRVLIHDTVGENILSSMLLLSIQISLCTSPHSSYI
ncbi:hypothetical protein CICLE_v10033161mg [Citrus x clementina]|uniref:Uncharacterized protein n=1 Tax=Citrus clementina TaxID=85681 RepID=V4VGK9_CITCL|nr:hypothetical protein CICLE_v10033161mg [Citrus x clementina]